MASTVVVGAQWGDEGKGKLVDSLAEKFDAVARYQGGNNAGHTVKVNEATFKLHFLPSGLINGKRSILGAGVLIEPVAFLKEISEISKQGVNITQSTLGVDFRCQLILPWHLVEDGFRENQNGAIGTTKKGIGPAYSEAYARSGIRICDLYEDDFEVKLEQVVKDKNVKAQLEGQPLTDYSALLVLLKDFKEKIAPFIVNGSEEVNQILDANKSVLFESAQGTFLDVRFGTYPYVTSSHPISGGACIGIGISPKRINRVEGVAKAYVTRVGNGEFPTELLDATGEAIRTKGAEFGTTTGRARRCGWLDLPMLRTANQLNGFDGLHITKLDVLAGHSKLYICVKYEINGVETNYFPQTAADLKNARPIYLQMPGFGDISKVSKYEDLPKEARDYLEVITKRTGIPILSIGIGADRKDTIWK